MTGISVCLFWASWALGVKRIDQKTIAAFGPFRFCIHRVKKTWGEY